MNRSKNDHIIEMAKKFIDNCNSFEIKDLDADKQYLNNLPAITPFTDRSKFDNICPTNGSRFFNGFA